MDRWMMLRERMLSYNIVKHWAARALTKARAERIRLSSDPNSWARTMDSKWIEHLRVTKPTFYQACAPVALVSPSVKHSRMSARQADHTTATLPAAGIHRVPLRRAAGNGAKTSSVIPPALPNYAYTYAYRYEYHKDEGGRAQQGADAAANFCSLKNANADAAGKAAAMTSSGTDANPSEHSKATMLESDDDKSVPASADYGAVRVDEKRSQEEKEDCAIANYEAFYGIRSPLVHMNRSEVLRKVQESSAGIDGWASAGPMTPMSLTANAMLDNGEVASLHELCVRESTRHDDTRTAAGDASGEVPPPPAPADAEEAADIAEAILQSTREMHRKNAKNFVACEA